MCWVRVSRVSSVVCMPGSYRIGRSAVREVVVRHGMVVAAIVTARIDVDPRGAQPGRLMQHRVPNRLGDVVRIQG